MSLTPSREPVYVGALVTLGANAVLTILTVFEVLNLTAEQTSAVYMALNFLVALAVAIKTRSVVWSPDTISLVNDGALEQALLEKADPPAHG